MARYFTQAESFNAVAEMDRWFSERDHAQTAKKIEVRSFEDEYIKREIDRLWAELTSADYD